jgi:hypothetical protein
MTTISPESTFGSVPIYGNYTKSYDKPNSTTVDSDDLIITQPEHSKMSRTSKNGRYISRLIDSITKMQTRSNVSEHDKFINNLSMYWYIRMLLLIEKSYDNSTMQDKLYEWYDLLNKFDRESDDYGGKLQYVYTILGDILKKDINKIGISRDNFMYKNFHQYDGIGLSTFTKDTWYTNDELELKSDIAEDKPEEKLTAYPELSCEQINITNQPVPKILHVVYYKDKIDITYLYVHLASYTANRDYKIIVWLPQLPDHQLRSNDHVEFKTFDDLTDGNYDRNIDNFQWNWDDKFKVKYYILKKYGGVYTNYGIEGVKKFNESLVKSSFVSVFLTNYREQSYICPLGFFMGFPPNHPFVDYILDNFQSGADICKTEYIYLRSALIKAQDQNIRLLNQMPENYENNTSYVVLREEDYKKQTKYFSFDDFDSTTSKTIQVDTESTESIESIESTESTELSDADLEELKSIENAVSKISKDHVNQNTSFTNYLWIFICGVIIAYFYSM